MTDIFGFDALPDAPPAASAAARAPQAAPQGFQNPEIEKRITVRRGPPTEPQVSQGEAAAGREPQVSQGEAAAVNAVQGLTANFGDEMQGAMAAGQAGATYPTGSNQGLTLTGPKQRAVEREQGPVDLITGLARMGYEALTGKNDPTLSSLVTGQQPKGEATKAYEEARDRWRATVERSQKQWPKTSLVANLGGAMMVPVGGAAGAGLGLGARTLRGAVTGAATGGLAGAGEGTDLADRAVKAGSGVVAGGLVGGAVPAVIGGGVVPRTLGGAVAGGVVGGVAGGGEGAIQGAGIGAGAGAGISGAQVTGRSLAKIGQRIRNPDAANELEAARRVATEYEKAQNRGARYTMPRSQFDRRAAEGEPVANIDMTGTGGRRLAKTAKNMSDVAEEELQGTLAGRAGWEGERTAQVINRMVGNKKIDVDSIRQAAREGNARAYQRAETESKALNSRALKVDPDGNGAFWTTELRRVAESPTMREIMLGIGKVEGDRSIIAGFARARKNPFDVGSDGRLTPRVLTTNPDGTPRTMAMPDIQAWDSVQRVVRGMIGEAERSGNREQVRRFTLLHKALVGELDKISPRFGEARGTAFRGFNAEDAYEAGQNYVTMSANKSDARDLEKAIKGFSASDRVVFMHGFAQSLINRVLEKGDSAATVNRIANSPAARARIVDALGTNRANELEAYLHVLKIQNAGKNAVQGNSSTMQQAADMAKHAAGEAVAPVLTGAAYGAATGNWDWGAILAGSAVGGTRYGYRRTIRGREEKIAEHVGRMLASSDPDVFQRGLTMVSHNGWMMNNLRNWGGPAASRALPPQTTQLLGSNIAGRAEVDQEPAPRLGNQ